MTKQEVDGSVGGLYPESLRRGRDPALPQVTAFRRGQAGLIHSVAGSAFVWFVVVAGRKVRVFAIESFDRLVGTECIALPGRSGGYGLPGARVVRRNGL